MFKMTDSRYALPIMASLAVLLLFMAPVHAASILPSNGEFTAANADQLLYCVWWPGCDCNPCG